MSALHELVSHYVRVRRRLQEPKPPKEPRFKPLPTAPLAAMLGKIAAAHKLTVNDIRSNCRNANIVRARQEFCYRAAVETIHSYPAIGRFIGRDHTTIIHAIRTHCDRNRLFPYPRGLPIDQNRYVRKRKPRADEAPSEVPFA